MEREHAGIFTVKPGPRGKPASAAVVRLAIGEPETFGARARNSRLMLCSLVAEMVC